MESQIFAVSFDPETGCVSRLAFADDPTGMNWCHLPPEGRWGFPVCRRPIYRKGKGFPADGTSLVSFAESGTEAVSVYLTERVRVTVRRSFSEEGNLRERFEITNITSAPVYLNRDSMAITLPFADAYTYAEECLSRRCHTHLWCGKAYSWVCALRMGPSEENLGLVLTEGSLDSYSQYGCKSNFRGIFEVETSPVTLLPGETTVLAWELFRHSGWDDFEEKLVRRGVPVLRADRYTVFAGEAAGIGVNVRANEMPTVTLDGQNVPVQKLSDGAYRFTDRADRTGERVYRVRVGEQETFCRILVKIPFAELAEKRAAFLFDRQQVRDERSPLDGAFLIFDNDTESPVFDDLNPDWNASRERLNMALFLARYLQLRPNGERTEAMRRFSSFLYREIYEKSTGEVFNTIGKRRDMLRLYNAPGIMLFFAEMYFLTKETSYLDDIVKLAENYYAVGGENCYSNAVMIRRVLTALSREGYEKEYARVRELFGRHVERMIGNGLDYPKHEVNYEQTIVTPVVNCLSEYGAFSPDADRYAEEAKKHLACLDRFAGRQPDHHLFAQSIRYWDGFWFGKARQFGDTFPHHLSVLSARANIAYYRLTGDRRSLDFAENCIRDCLSLVGDDGRGSAAYLYPHVTNERPGQFYDRFANDQDLVLYDALLSEDILPGFAL